jgi:hypothetical protein
VGKLAQNDEFPFRQILLRIVLSHALVKREMARIKEGIAKDIAISTMCFSSRKGLRMPWPISPFASFVVYQREISRKDDV